MRTILFKLIHNFHMRDELNRIETGVTKIISSITLAISEPKGIEKKAEIIVGDAY